jgi:hypothetical protein
MIGVAILTISMKHHYLIIKLDIASKVPEVDVRLGLHMAECCSHCATCRSFNEGEFDNEELNSCLNSYDYYHHCLFCCWHLQVKHVL